MNAAPERGSGPGKGRPLYYYDAHNHLQDEELSPHQDRIFAALQRLPVGGSAVNGTSEQDWARVSVLSEKHDWIVPSFGLHPWQVGQRSGDWQTVLEALLRKHPRAGLGEIGLDRWIVDRASTDDRRLGGLRRASLAEQEEIFLLQLQLATRQNRAATVHCVGAWGRMGEILRSSPLPPRGVLLHAYGGPPELVPDLLERGAYFSFNGSFLDARKERQREVFRALRLDRLLVETDAPSMPLPLLWRTYQLPSSSSRTVLNHPANLEASYTGLAALRGHSQPELCAAVAENFQRFFQCGIGAPESPLN